MVNNEDFAAGMQQEEEKNKRSVIFYIRSIFVVSNEKGWSEHTVAVVQVSFCGIIALRYTMWNIVLPYPKYTYVRTYVRWFHDSNPVGTKWKNVTDAFGQND